MTPWLDDGDVRVYHGDCIEVMRELPEASVDAIVTDPPYGLEFMGREWDAIGRNVGPGGKRRERERLIEDREQGKWQPGSSYGAHAKNPRCKHCSRLRFDHDDRRCSCALPLFDARASEYGIAMQEWHEAWAREALRVLKPGGHALVFGGTRTFHRLTCGLEDAGFEIRDSLSWGHQRHVFCQCSTGGPDAEGAVRDLRGGGSPAAEPAETDDHDDLLLRVQRGDPRSGMEDARIEGTSGVESTGAGVGSGEDARSSEPGMEGRSHLQTPEGELPPGEVRACAGVGAPDGQEGWLRNGAPPGDGDALRLPVDEVGSGPSPGPRPAEQLAGEPGALAVEWIPQGGGAWPGCPRCHLPLPPPFDAGPLVWNYGSGFPKSLDVSKAIDKAAGAEREVISYTKGRSAPIHAGGQTVGIPDPITAPATDEARRWQGWGTALKPAWEPVVVARKPLAGTVAANVLEHGTGGLNIDGCRVGTAGGTRGHSYPKTGMFGIGGNGTIEAIDAGRWPANVVLDDDAAAMLDEQTGEWRTNPPGKGSANRPSGFAMGAMDEVGYHGDTGGASRFFYTAKASTSERDGSRHPTVKPLALMRWLVRLVTPPRGVVLDPFAGSGTTLLAAREEGFRAIGIEREDEYLRDIAHRLRQLSLLGEGS